MKLPSLTRALFASLAVLAIAVGSPSAAHAQDCKPNGTTPDGKPMFACKFDTGFMFGTFNYTGDEICEKLDKLNEDQMHYVNFHYSTWLEVQMLAFEHNQCERGERLPRKVEIENFYVPATGEICTYMTSFEPVWLGPGPRLDDIDLRELCSQWVSYMKIRRGHLDVTLTGPLCGYKTDSRLLWCQKISQFPTFLGNYHY